MGFRKLLILVGSDSMRVGKTTAVGVIAAGLREGGHIVQESYEDWEHNPYLAGSYADPSQNFLDSQKWFARRKCEQIRQAHSRQDGGVWVQDVPPEMDYNYALTNYQIGRMNKAHFKEYDKFYHGLEWGELARPALLVYLTISDEELVRRTKESRREFETVDTSYFLAMKRVNRKWVDRLNNEYRVLRVPADRMNFASKEEDKNALVQMVQAELAKL